MKAVLHTKYGPPEVLQVQEVPTPIPKDHEVLIKIVATTVTAEDPKQRSFTFSPLLWLPARIVFGLRKPKHSILGFELAGEVVATGKDVQQFKTGDRVYGLTDLSFGTYAEYKCMTETGLLSIKPTNMTYEEAAAIPNGALTSLVYLRNLAHIQDGEKVLIYGASGSVGTAAVQLAKYFGAEVTGVCSTPNVAMVQSLGADRVIDYTKEHYTNNRETYDIIFDTVGKTSLSQSKRMLKKNGRYLLTVFGLQAILQMLWTSLVGGKKVLGTASNFHWKPDDLNFLNTLIETGQLKSVIDRQYPLEQAVQAHHYVEQGHKKGNVVLTVSSSV